MASLYGTNSPIVDLAAASLLLPAVTPCCQNFSVTAAAEVGWGRFDLPGIAGEGLAAFLLDRESLPVLPAAGEGRLS